MPDVGTLNIEITSNAEEAAKGLGTLAQKLGSVKKNAAGFDLSNVQTNIKNIVDAVKGSEKTMASLGTLFNATATYFKAFGKITDKININTKPIKDLKEAFGDGIKTGNVGSQLNQLRTALEGEWKTDNAYNAGIVLSAISQGAKDAESVNLSSTAKNIGSLANSLNEYASAVERISGASDTEGIKALFDVLGKFVPEGYSSGIRSGKDAVGESSAEMIKAGYESAANEQKSHSTSLIYEELGSYAGEGYVEGIRSKISAVTAIVAEMVQSAIASSEGKTAKVAEAVSAAVKTAFSSALSGMDISDVQKSLIQRTADLTADVVKAMATTSKADLGQTGKIAADTITSAMSGAVDKALDVVKPLQEGMQQVNAELQTAGTTVENSIDQGIKETVSVTTEMNERLQMTNEELQEQLRIRKEIMEAQNQTRLENNYPLYRELYMSGEGDWKQQVPEMYGFTEKAIENNENYADALKETLQEVNAYVDTFIEKQNAPAGPLFADILTQADNAKLAMKQASESAAVLKNAPEIVEVASGMEQVKSATQTVGSAMERTKSATRVLTDDMKDLDKELKRKKPDAETATKGINKFGFSLKDLKKGIKSAFPLLAQLGSRLKSIIIRRTLTAALRKVVSSAKEGLQNVYEYSKLIGSGFSSSMDGAASSLAQMKNALGAALAPAVQMLIPLLQQVVSWFINLVNYANQFFALLNGQKTWTRALPQTVSAFDKQKKAAKGAGAAIKDLLADWDELNIIQSESSGGGGAGTTAAEDYLKMFEEVSRFDNKVKDVVNFIKDNFDTILSIVEGIGAAILLWKISEAFGHSLNMLQKLELAAGLTLLITGVKLASAAGYDIGKNGLNDTNMKDAVESVVVSALGGALIGLAFGGWVGGLIGLVAGTVLSLVVLHANIEKGKLDALYGDVHKDVADIVAELEEGILTPEAKMKIDVVNAALKDVGDAEGKVSDALQDLSKSYPVGVEVTPDDATDFKTKVDALVSETNTLIQTSKDTLAITVPATAAFTENFVRDAWANVSEYVTELGKLIGEELDKSITDNAKLDELKEKLLSISRTVLTATKSSELVGNVGSIGASARENTRLGKYDRETIANYVEQFGVLLSEKMGEATGFAQAEFVEKNRLKTSLEESIEGYQDLIAAGGLTEQEVARYQSEIADMTKQLEVVKNEIQEKFGMNGEKIGSVAQAYYDEWTQTGREIYSQDISGALKVAMSNNPNKWRLSQNLIGASSEDLFNANLRDVDKYIWYMYRDLYETIGKSSGMDVKNLQTFFETSGINPLTMFDEDFVKQYQDNIITWLGRSSVSEDDKKRILEAFGLNFDEEIQDRLEKVRLGQLLAGKDRNSQFDILKNWLDTSGLSDTRKEGILSAIGFDKHSIESTTKTWDGYLFDDSTLEGIYKHLNWQLADAGYEGGNRAKYQSVIEELKSTSAIEAMQWLKDQIEQYGVSDAFKMWNVFENTGTYPTSPDTSGVLRNPERVTGAMGESSVGWGYTTNANNEAITEQDLTKAVASGTETANRNQNDILNSIMRGVEALLRKNWTVNITPTSALGSVNRGAAAAIERITGTIG